MTDGLKIETLDGVTTIALNDPATLNALTPELAVSLTAALKNAAQNSRAIILTGSSRAFCSGANLQASPAAKSSDINAGSALDQA